MLLEIAFKVNSFLNLFLEYYRRIIIRSEKLKFKSFLHQEEIIHEKENSGNAGLSGMPSRGVQFEFPHFKREKKTILLKGFCPVPVAEGNIPSKRELPSWTLLFLVKQKKRFQNTKQRRCSHLICGAITAIF